jgi:hypothetical protein
MCFLSQHGPHLDGDERGDRGLAEPGGVGYGAQSLDELLGGALAVAAAPHQDREVESLLVRVAEGMVL